MLTINPWSSTRLYIIFYSIRHRKHKKFFARPLAKPHHGFNNRHAFCREFRVAVDYRLSPAESISSSDILNGISTSCTQKKIITSPKDHGQRGKYSLKAQSDFLWIFRRLNDHFSTILRKKILECEDIKKKFIENVIPYTTK